MLFQAFPYFPDNQPEMYSSVNFDSLLNHPEILCIYTHTHLCFLASQVKDVAKCVVITVSGNMPYKHNNLCQTVNCPC